MNLYTYWMESRNRFNVVDCTHLLHWAGWNKQKIQYLTFLQVNTSCAEHTSTMTHSRSQHYLLLSSSQNLICFQAASHLGGTDNSPASELHQLWCHSLGPHCTPYAHTPESSNSTPHRLLCMWRIQHKTNLFVTSQINTQRNQRGYIKRYLTCCL